ncbi:MAG: hypothetical protein R3F35_15315 [Myxococcota bacterium]
MQHFPPSALILIPSALILATSALASGGVAEINQTCAVLTGCFPGDTAGFPVTIDGSAGRSFRLTSDLVLPDENTDGIVVGASDIAVDLHGFTIIRAACVGATASCVPASGSGSGVERTSSAMRGTAVRNGSIVGMGLIGVFLGDQAEVTNVRARWNRLDGINVTLGAVVVGNTTFQNGRNGIGTSFGATISTNTTYDNGGDGISVSTASTVTGNTSYGNSDDGIVSTAGSTISGNTVGQNSGIGINAGTGSIVSDNAIYSNGGGGVVTGTGSLVRGNVLRENSPFGISTADDTVCSGNAVSAVIGSRATITCDVNGGGNYCNGASGCP